MRIGLLTQWFEPEPGPAAIPGALARGLVARGHEVEVVTGFPNYPDGVIAPGYRVRPRSVEQDNGVRVTRVALYPSHDSSAKKRMLNYGSFAISAATLGVPRSFRSLDALWVNYSPVTIAVPLHIQRLLHRTPTVAHVLDLWPDTLSATGFVGGGLPSRMALRGVDALCRSMYRSAERVAYISPGVGPLLMARGVPPDKLAYAPMWADETLFAPHAAPTPRGFGLRHDQVALVYAGTLGRAQGLETLIEACSRLRDQPLTCLVAGSGTEEERLRDLASKLGADNVRFLGRLPKAEMPGLAASADLHYVTLNDHPLARVTMPSKVQAILASGGPILGSLVGDAATVVEESGAGWVTAPGDVSALTDALHRAVAVGRNGLMPRREAARAYYERTFAYDMGVDNVERLLAEAVEAGGRSR